MKLLLIGPYPPPYGGIATTVRDLHAYMSVQEGCRVVVLNTGDGRRVPSPRYVRTSGYGDYFRKVLGYALRQYTMHLETNGHNLKSWLSAFVCAAAGLVNGRKTVIAFGSGNLPAYVREVGGWRRLMVRAVTAWAGILICRNQEMYDALLAAGAAAHKIRLVPGFLGLGVNKPGVVSTRTQKFLNAHSPVLGVTASLAPEYGLPLLLAAVERLRPMFPRIGVVIMGPGPEAKDQIEGFHRVKGQVHLTGPVAHEEVLGIMKELTLFIRPSYFDGDSNSVREALILGVPVVASDTAYRPPEAITFEKGNLEDLVRTVEGALENPDESRARARSYSQEDGFAQIIHIYRTLVGDTAGASEADDEKHRGVQTVAGALRTPGHRI